MIKMKLTEIAEQIGLPALTEAEITLRATEGLQGEALKARLTELGYDPDEFLAAYNDDR